jgi:hypothetical protein
LPTKIPQLSGKVIESVHGFSILLPYPLPVQVQQGIIHGVVFEHMFRQLVHEAMGVRRSLVGPDGRGISIGVHASSLILHSVAD